MSDGASGTRPQTREIGAWFAAAAAVLLAGAVALGRLFGGSLPPSLGAVEKLGELRVPAEASPAGGRAVVCASRMRRIGAELEQRLDRLAPAGLRGEVERGHALAVIRPAERAAAGSRRRRARRASRTDATRPFDRRPRERRAAVGVGVDPRAELDEQRRAPRRGRLFAAQTSASSSTSCGSSDGCHAGKPPCGR